MKLNKLFLLSSLLIPLVSMTSCGETPKLAMLYGTKCDSKAIVLSYSELETKILDNDIFALAIIPSCGCVGSFEYIIDKYVEKYDYLIYRISSSELEGKSKTYNIPFYDDRPSFVLFSDGAINRQQVYSDTNASFFNSDSSFKKWMDENTVAPNAFYISKEQLDIALLTTNQKMIISYTQSSCPDCMYLQRHALKDYLKNNSSRPNIYLLDVWTAGIRLNSEGEQDLVQWEAFKDKYGLSEINNAKYGYSTGFVPTLQYIETCGAITPSEYVIDATVYVNDEVSKNGEGNYYLSRSFYTTSRLNNIHYASQISSNVLQDKILNSNEVGVYGETYFYWMHEYAAKYHDPLLVAYLNTYHELITYVI